MVKYFHLGENFVQMKVMTVVVPVQLGIEGGVTFICVVPLLCSLNLRDKLLGERALKEGNKV